VSGISIAIGNKTFFSLVYISIDFDEVDNRNESDQQIHHTLNDR